MSDHGHDCSGDAPVHKHKGWLFWTEAIVWSVALIAACIIWSWVQK